MNRNREWISPSSISRQMEQLWRRQITEWPMLVEGVESLRLARTRSFNVGQAQIVAQNNIARRVSAVSRIDPESLASRPCILCPDNLPKEQHTLDYRGQWVIVCNPYPLVEPHFTIISRPHQPQRLAPAVGTLLDMAREVGHAYTLFYNGPQSGASLPDHLHIQAVRAGVLPFERQLASHLCGSHGNGRTRWVDWLQKETIRIGLTRSEYRKAVLLVGQNKAALLADLEKVTQRLGAIQEGDPEPRLNLFVTHTDDCWIMWLFPRRRHRARSYGDGPADLLISPGAIDMSGLLIVPRPEDFDRLDETAIADLYNDVLITDEQYHQLHAGLNGQ